MRRSITARPMLIALAVLALTAVPATASTPNAAPAPTAEIEAKKRCTPGYKPCIPNKRSDVDCHGGSGNGPRYTKPGVTYRVKGSDRYGLDADNDGWGCE